MIRIVVLHMCIDFIFQNFGQKVVEIISIVLKSCLSKVSFLLFRQKKNLDIKINKDTRRAWDCWIMYCLYNVLLNGFHVSLFRRVLPRASFVFWSVCVMIYPQIQGQAFWFFCGSSSTRRWWVHHCWTCKLV